jgi:hypothetical protein
MQHIILSLAGTDKVKFMIMGDPYGQKAKIFETVSLVLYNLHQKVITLSQISDSYALESW